MVEASRADGRRNRQAIVEAAAALVAESGDAQTIAFTAVAQRAGVTRATVYRHFADRHALVLAVARDRAERLLTPLLAEMDRLPLAEAWRLLASLVVEASRAHGPVLGAIGLGPEEAARLAVEDEPIAAFVVRRRATGEITSALPDAWIARCVRAVCLVAVADTSGPAEEQVESLTATLASLTR